MTEQEYWNARYAAGGNSGYGSYDDQLVKKLRWLGDLKGVKTITEVGCGDFHFGQKVVGLFPGSKYTGLDVSDVIVRWNQALYPEHNFRVVDGVVPSADLLMCVDVLFHVYEDDVADKLINQLVQSWTKYLVLTAYEYDGLRRNHIRIRRFDPAVIGRPVLRQVIEEDGQLYLYIFEK